MRPIGRGAEFDEWRANQETSRWDSFVQNAKDDPLGTAVLVAVVIVAVALIVAATVFSGGTIWLVIGAGALVGAGAVTAMGFATKSFNPRSAAVAGVVGGLAAGAAWLALPLQPKLTNWKDSES